MAKFYPSDGWAVQTGIENNACRRTSKVFLPRRVTLAASVFSQFHQFRKEVSVAHPETSPKGMARSARRFLRLTKVCLLLSAVLTLFLGLCFSWHWPVLSSLAATPFLFVWIGLTRPFVEYERPIPYEGKVIHFVNVGLPAVYHGRKPHFERARIMRKRMRSRIRWLYAWRRSHRFDRLRFVCIDASAGRFAVVASLSVKHREAAEAVRQEETVAPSG